MSTKPNPKKRPEPLGASYQPSKRDILRPAELVGGSAIGAIFVGLIVLMTTQLIPLTLISAGITFIVILMVLALFAIGGKKDAEENADIEAQNDAAARKENPDTRH